MAVIYGVFSGRGSWGNPKLERFQPTGQLSATNVEDAIAQAAALGLGGYYNGGPWNPFTATLVPTSGAITTQSSNATSLAIGKLVFVSIDITVTTIGTGVGPLTFNVPVAPVRNTIIPGREGITGKMIQAVLTAGSLSASMFNYDNTAPGFANGSNYNFSGSYESQ
jgi:hypothetical protein